MKKLFYSLGAAALLAIIIISCQKSKSDAATTEPSQLSADEKAMVRSAGFNSGWAEKTADGNYLVEGDMLFTKAQLEELAAKTPDYNFIIANEEHYRTTNLVSTGTGRVITVRLGSGFPSHYSTGLDQAIARYNSYGLLITFQRVTTGGDIVISGANLGRTIGGGCILGQAAGFPSGGNPSAGFTLSTNKCATQYINTADKADEVIAHEMGHCIGFRHTDYMNRSSCGSNSNEGDAGVGAIHIPGTPETVTGNYNSWMMACTNGSPLFSAEDGTALTTVY
jgi:Dual-action HEIGH metallo-peptidase